MKSKHIVTWTIVWVVVLSIGCFIGCAGSSTIEGQEYIIQYSDDNGTHRLTVTDGMPYSLDTIPEKAGHTFVGLFDAETGGTQYVSSNGTSLATFDAGKNLVLFPRFEAKMYTIVLDYQGATGTGTRQFTVTYGSVLPDLPTDLHAEQKKFMGWYTAANCAGVCVSDTNGLIPVVSVLNGTHFDFSKDTIYLYAGFSIKEYTVTFNFGTGILAETVQVAYGTPIDIVMPKTRVDGKAVLNWSRTKGGSKFNGTITEDMTLYAVDFAPVIDFDCAGGSRVNSIVAQAGTAVILPIPKKDMAKFLYWADEQGNERTITSMPQESIILKAVWQAKIVFNENGGSLVEDISVEEGSVIVLPTSRKEGYIFAGWYTDGNALYTSAVMPRTGICLKAGWYKEKSETVVKLAASETSSGHAVQEPQANVMCFSIDCDSYLGSATSVTLKIDWHVEIWLNTDTVATAYADFYSQRQISTAYWMKTCSFANISDEYTKCTFTTTFTVDDTFYICFYNKDRRGQSVRNFYYTVYYPDTSKLYL